MIILDKLNINQLNQKDKHGLIIIAIAIISRIFVVSIAWSYGIFLKALKEKYPNSYYVELGWIAGLAQGLGMIISPLYVIIAKRVGYRLTFTVGLGLCALSLFSSSFIPNEHYLFLTYSLPFGIGSGITFVLGSVVTGLYYPPKSAYHIMATVAISLGFPLGFLILNFITDSLLHLTNDWQKVQFIYSLIALVCTVAFFPFFTEKYAEYDEVENEATQEVICNEPLLFGLTKERFQFLVRFLWLSGLIVNSCANNSVLIHLNGYFKSLGFNQSELKNAFFAIGLSDAVTRILLAIKGHVVKYNLLFCYITSVAIGFLLSIFWSLQTSASFNTFYCIFFGICPAILMSLMYSVNLEIYGSGTIQKNYTINVMTSGIGIILGPIISGAVLDSSVMSYDSVFKLSYKLYFLAILLYSATKFLLMKYTQISASEQVGQDSVGGYEELK